MTKYLFLFLGLFFNHILLTEAQTLSKEYGRIGQYDVDYTCTGEDKAAEAVVLYDIGKSYFIRDDNGFDLVFERRTRIKIFSEPGRKWADIEIPIYHKGEEWEKIYDVEAYTYNMEGGVLKKTKFDNIDTHDEKKNEHWDVKKFAIPNVKDGTVIEYKYKVITPFVFNLENWKFQWRIPVVYSEYNVAMIPFYEYSYLLQGADHFDAQKSFVSPKNPQQIAGINYGEMIHEFVMENVPAFKDEEFISSINDYIIKMNFQLAQINSLHGGTSYVVTTWPDLIRDLKRNENFGRHVNKSGHFASKLFNMDSLSKMSQVEKYNLIMNKVKSSISWNDHKGIYTSKSAGNLVDTKTGNCADINLFAIGLLNEAGIEAYPVLISTRDHGKIKYDYPYLDFFNYVIIFANVDGKNILADATEIHGSNSRISPGCINDMGLIINKEEVKWVSLEFKMISDLQTNLNLNLDGQKLSAHMSLSATEYDALELRNKYGENHEKIKTHLVEKGYGVVDSTITVQNQSKKEAPYLMSCDVTLEIEEINNKIYISPFLNETLSINPLKQKTRSYPIDMVYATKHNFTSVIHIPEGYHAEFTPETEHIKNELFEMNYLVDQKDNQINISFTYSFKNPVYEAADYTKIKYYYLQIIKKGNEKVVLVKDE